MLNNIVVFIIYNYPTPVSFILITYIMYIIDNLQYAYNYSNLGHNLPAFGAKIGGCGLLIALPTVDVPIIIACLCDPVSCH